MYLINLSRRTKKAILVFTDAFLGLISWIVVGPPLASFLSQNNINSFLESIILNFYGFLISITFAIIYFNFNDMYKSVSRLYEPGMYIFSNLFGGIIFGISWALLYLYKIDSFEINFTMIILLQGLVLSIVFFALTSTSRLLVKTFLNPFKISKDFNSVIIYGAGASGVELYYLLKSDPGTKVIAFIDDNKDMIGMKIDGIEVYKNIEKIKEIISAHERVEVLLAIPSINIEQRRKILERLQKFKVSVRSIPSMHELVGDFKRMNELQELSLEDLLPKNRYSQLNSIDLNSEVVLVTGAGGSIGSEIVRQIIGSNCLSIILLDFSEFNLFRVYEEALSLKKSLESDVKITPILHDICSTDTLKKVLEKFSITHIYHAAAYKHVPMLEFSENILTGIRNNIIGTYSICLIAESFNVKKLIMVSTDKAVRPTNLMGATKRFSEQVVQNFDMHSKNTVFSMVRFGNVINSSGSVIPTFIKQISHGGPLTITDLNVTRYFMTIPEASNLVLQAGEMSSGGEVFILDMGKQVKIVDLAKRLINLKGYNYTFEKNMPGIRIIETGLRPGEKLFEELLISGKEIQTDNPKIFKSIEPNPPEDIISILDFLNNRIFAGDINACIEVLSKNVHGFIR